MSAWKIIAGSKVTLVAVTALVAGLISFFTIRYIQQAERDKVTIELQEQQMERRQRVDEGIRSAPVNVDDSLQYLRDRQRGE